MAARAGAAVGAVSWAGPSASQDTSHVNPEPMPVLFVGHGAPTIVLEGDPLARVLGGIAAALPKPAAVIAVSAHWETDAAMVTGAAAPTTIHDFQGFPEALYRLRYPARGAGDVVRRVAELTGAATDPSRGLDHGAWVPLMMLYPDADVPVVQLSVCPGRGAQWHRALGEKLKPLRAEGCLILGSGGICHNLGRLDWHAAKGQAAGWAAEFEAAVDRALTDQHSEALAHPWSLPHGQDCVPTAEHYLPLLVAAGAGEAPRCLHRDWHFGSLAIHCYAFGWPAQPRVS
jgi:4,5-DOPA dioxygenase extradiol